MKPFAKKTSVHHANGAESPMTKPRMTRPSERDRAYYLERERVRDRKRRQAAQVKKDLARRVLPDTPIDVLTQHGHHGPGLLTMKKLARLILAGQNLTVCARRLKKNYTYLKKVACLPEFKVYMAEMEKDYFESLDQRIKHLLGDSVDAMAKMLRHPDWRARDAAPEKILRLNGKLERLELSGQVRPAIQAELVPERDPPVRL